MINAKVGTQKIRWAIHEVAFASQCEAYSNDAQTLGNVGPAAGPESW